MSDYFSNQPGGESDAAPRGPFIGVPDNHSVPATLGDYFKPGGSFNANGFEVPTNTPHLPKYEKGAEQVIRSLSVEDLARLQGRLAQVGLIGPETRFRVGIPDPTTVTAYGKLLGIANNYAISDSDALDMLAETPSLLGAEAAGEGGAYNGPTRNVTISDPIFTDPMTAKSTLRSTLADRVGRDPTDSEYDRFLDNLHSAEGGQDREVRITTPTGEGKTRTRVKRSDKDTDPTAATVADDMSRRGALGREANTMTAATDYYGAMQNILNGGAP